MAANTLHEPWPEELTEELIACYEAGMRWHQIAERLGRTREACRSKARNLNLTKGKSKGYNAKQVNLDDLHDLLLLGYDQERIAREMGMHKHTIRRHLERRDAHLYRIWRRQAKKRQREGLHNRWRTA